MRVIRERGDVEQQIDRPILRPAGEKTSETVRTEGLAWKLWINCECVGMEKEALSSSLTSRQVSLFAIYTIGRP